MCRDEETLDCFNFDFDINLKIKENFHSISRFIFVLSKLLVIYAFTEHLVGDVKTLKTLNVLGFLYENSLAWLRR